MARKRKQILPFRIPFFRIFYSTTYTIILIITLCFLAITPGSLLLESIEAGALQYVFIIGGVYILTALVAIFIYTSRLYTNRLVLAAVGKAYIPIEDGEIGQKIRNLIVNQLERSAVIAWEAKPRDVAGEALQEDLPRSAEHSVGTVVPVKIAAPPWGDIQHRGWTAPSDIADEYPSNLHFDVVIAELPYLLEARAVSLAPMVSNEPDASLVNLLKRQETACLREYLTQLSYLGVVDLNGKVSQFLSQYEKARFSGTPPSYPEFKALMSSFALVLDTMSPMSRAIVDEVHAQSKPTVQLNTPDSYVGHPVVTESGGESPVTAQTRMATPYLSQGGSSFESAESVLCGSSSFPDFYDWQPSTHGDDGSSLASGTGSVVHHHIDT